MRRWRFAAKRSLVLPLEDINAVWSAFQADLHAISLLAATGDKGGPPVVAASLRGA